MFSPRYGWKTADVAFNTNKSINQWFPWHSGFRGVNETVNDGRRTPSDDKSPHGLWPGELKIYLFEIVKCKIQVLVIFSGGLDFFSSSFSLYLHVFFFPLFYHFLVKTALLKWSQYSVLTIKHASVSKYDKNVNNMTVARYLQYIKILKTFFLK